MNLEETLDNGTYAILIPLGMPARVRPLARLLLIHQLSRQETGAD